MMTEQNRTDHTVARIKLPGSVQTVQQQFINIITVVFMPNNSFTKDIEIEKSRVDTNRETTSRRLLRHQNRDAACL